MTNYDNTIGKTFSGFDKQQNRMILTIRITVGNSRISTYNETKVMITIHYKNSEKRINVHKTVKKNHDACQ